MAPTLRNGQYVLATLVEAGRRSQPFSRGTLWAFRDPERGRDLRIKRVVGRPDEHVAIRDGRIEVNGVPIEEPYLEDSTVTAPKGASQWFTGPDEYFLLGDNRGPSRDSRAYGPVGRQLIVGRLQMRFWPPRML